MTVRKRLSWDNEPVIGSKQSSLSDFLNEHLDFKEFYVEEKMTQDQHQIYRMIFMMSPGVILFLGKFFFRKRKFELINL